MPGAKTFVPIAAPVARPPSGGRVLSRRLSASGTVLSVEVPNTHVTAVSTPSTQRTPSPTGQSTDSSGSSARSRFRKRQVALEALRGVTGELAAHHPISRSIFSLIDEILVRAELVETSKQEAEQLKRTIIGVKQALHSRFATKHHANLYAIEEVHRAVRAAAVLLRDLDPLRSRFKKWLVAKQANARFDKVNRMLTRSIQIMNLAITVFQAGELEALAVGLRDQRRKDAIAMRELMLAVEQNSPAAVARRADSQPVEDKFTLGSTANSRKSRHSI